MLPHIMMRGDIADSILGVCYLGGQAGWKASVMTLPEGKCTEVSVALWGGDRPLSPVGSFLVMHRWELRPLVSR